MRVQNILHIFLPSMANFKITLAAGAGDIPVGIPGGP